MYNLIFLNITDEFTVKIYMTYKKIYKTKIIISDMKYMIFYLLLLYDNSVIIFNFIY
jgi:hypothetical protein